MSNYRRLPHLAPWAANPITFLTVVTTGRRPVLACQPAYDVLTAIWRKSADCDGWFVGDYLLMPDHLHLFARPATEAKSLPQWLKTWKSLSTRRLSRPLGIGLQLWQRDYFDRFLRSAENYSQKWD